MIESALTINEPTPNDLEELFVNNSDMDKIRAYSSRFNPIRVMRAADKELRHSSILGWLFTPNETHGLGDQFLRAFLSEALRGMGSMKPSALDVAQADLRDSEVRLEWRNIDIFVLSPRNQWAFIIENKFHSQQHDGQLTTYKKRAQEVLNAATEGESEKSIVRGIFLSLHEETPQDSDFAAIRYQMVCEFLRRFLEQSAHVMSLEVRTFLGHYLEILEEELGMSTQRNEMELLARKLYRDHKKVIDFVVEHGAGSDFALAARTIFGENPQPLGDPIVVAGRHLIFCGLTNSRVSFIPETWLVKLKDITIWHGCENWWAGLPIIAWFEITTEQDGVGGKIILTGEVGPLKPSEDRLRLIKDIEEIASVNKLDKIQFSAGAKDQGKMYSRFLKKNSIRIDDVHESESIRNAMSKLIVAFSKELDAVGDAISNFIDYPKNGQDA